MEPLHPQKNNTIWKWLLVISILAVLVAVVVVGIMTSHYFLSILIGAVIPKTVIWLLGKVFPYRDQRDFDTEKKPLLRTVDNLITHYGEPDDIILLDATRGNDPDSAILVYNAKGVLIVNGEEVDKNDIADITFNNAAVPYLPSDYQIMLTTRGARQKTFYLHTGNDIEWTRVAAEKLSALKT